MYCFVVALLCVSVSGFALAEDIPSGPRKYDGDQVFAVDAPTKEAWEIVLSIMNDYIPIQDQDVWLEPRKSDKRGFILVPRAYRNQVAEALEKFGISFAVKIPDVQRLITTSLERNEERKQFNRQFGANNINGTFPRYDDVIAWMQDLSRSYPQLASTFSIGITTFNRPMQVLKLGLGNGNKWRVWIDAGLHAREWLAPTTAIYVTDKLVTGYTSNDRSITELLEFFDFYIMPVANPDGYEYCHTGERLWRKNRRPINATCTGVDLNRNFGFQWGGVNADPDACSNLYRGPYADSEIEVLNFERFLLTDASKYLLYHAYHTWGELFFSRWDYSGSASVPDNAELIDLATRAVNSINHVHGERYAAGIAPELMYAFAGSSSDWARGVANIKYPFLTELRDFGGDYAFIAPVEEIEPCGEENWQGLYSILVSIAETWKYTQPPL